MNRVCLNEYHHITAGMLAYVKNVSSTAGMDADGELEAL